jgi:uncharacterized coiled-coil protein SlyX
LRRSLTTPPGGDNTATGWGALSNNTTGVENTANGVEALSGNTTGGYNTATGVFALARNTTGNNNTANGFAALQFNTTGNNNMADGFNALGSNTAGHDNAAVGFQALLGNTTGSNNIALGSNAGSKLTSGSNNIEIGANVPGVAGEANTIRIGKSGTQQKTFVAGIYGKTVASGVGVIINSTGQLGTVQSSARFKDDIKPMDKASEAVLKLKPVTFRYKEELDPEKIPQFGLIAEDVEKVNPDLVTRDDDHNVVTVRYEAVNAMLLNEFLKEHQKVEEQQHKLELQEKKAQEQEATITEFESTVTQQQKSFESRLAQQTKQIEALTSGLQKVSSQLETRQPARRVVVNTP